MSGQNDAGVKTFEADAAIALHARVKLESDGKIVTAGLTDKDIGTALREAFASGDHIPVKLRSAAGTHLMIANEAFDAGADLYTEANGKVQDTAAATAFYIGSAMEAAGAQDDIVEVLYNAHGDTAAT